MERGPQQEPLESTTAATISFEEKSRNSARVEKETSQSMPGSTYIAGKGFMH